MNGFLLMIPFFLVRFGLLAKMDRRAVQRAAHFAPMQGGEVTAYWVYQVCTAFLILYPLFVRITSGPPVLLCTGAALYIAGLALLAASIIHFSRPDGAGLNTGGVYRFTRNPMYVAYFLYFMGIAVLARSALLFCVVAVFQFSAHWIILAEERECRQRFGASYEQYCKKVRRYF